MAKIGVRLTKLHCQKIGDVAAKKGVPFSTYVKTLIQDALVSKVDVGDRELPTGEVTLQVRLDDELRNLVNEASKAVDMRVTAWVYNLILLTLSEQAHEGVAALINDFFNADNLSLSSAAYRRNQHRLALQFGEQMMNGKIGINEASTGTGKSLAILVAAHAVRAHQSKDVPVVIATATRVLQAQLLDDAVTYRHAFVAIFKSQSLALLYGKANYVSPTLAKRMCEDGELSEDDRGALSAWVDTHAEACGWLVTSLREHVSDTFPIEVITCESGADDVSIDPYILAREKAKDADIVVTSQHMLILSLQNKGGILHNIKYAIIDEAHALENTAETVLSSEISLAATGWSARKLKSNLFELGRNKEAKAFRNWVLKLESLHQSMREIASGDELVTLVSNGKLHPKVSSVSGIIKELSTLPHIPRTVKLSVEGKIALIKLREFAGVASQLEKVASSGYGTVICTLSETLHYARLITSVATGIRATLKRILWDKLEAISCCSATLGVQSRQGYSYTDFINSVGLKNCDRILEETPLIEPWLYDNAQLYLAKESAPVPCSDQGEARDAWLAYLAMTINELDTHDVSNERGGVMVLCTSYADIEDLMPLLKIKHRKLITQKRGVPVKGAAKAFADANGNAVLIGLGSLWTGVDFKGRILTDLVISRLPISAGRSGGLMARFNYVVEQAGVGQAVTALLLPRAKIVLRQGIGRLVRSKNDKGRIYITDPRVLSKTAWSFKQTLKDYAPMMEIQIKGEVNE